MTSQNGDFRFLAKCQVCDVALGGGSVAFTSGFRFPVGLDLYCSNCRRDLVGNYYFRFGERRKIAKMKFWWSLLTVFIASLACHTGCTRPAVEGECAPLLTTKYEPDVIKTVREIISICLECAGAQEKRQEEVTRSVYFTSVWSDP